MGTQKGWDGKRTTVVCIISGKRHGSSRQFASVQQYRDAAQLTVVGKAKRIPAICRAAEKGEG